MLSLELVQKPSFCPPSVSPNGEAGEALAKESLSVTLIKYRFFIPLRSIQNDSSAAPLQRVTADYTRQYSAEAELPEYKRKVFGQPPYLPTEHQGCILC